MTSAASTGGGRIRNLIEVGRYDEARTALTTALASDPDNGELHGLLAQTLLGLGDPPAALAAGSRFVELEPDREWAHRLCSIALSRLGRSQRALDAAAEAVRLAPFQWQAHHRYASAARALQGRLIDAHAAAQRAVQLAPNEPEAHVTLGVVQAQRHQFEEARASYLRVLELDPDHGAARNNLAVLDGGLRLGRQTRGFLAALRSDPNSEVAQRNLEAFLPSLVFRLWLIFGAGLVVALLVTVHGEAPDDSDPGVASYAVLGVLVAGCGAYVTALVRHLPRGVLAALWRRQRRSLLTWWNILATVILVAGLVTVCVVPGAGAFGVELLRPLFLGLIIASVAAFVRHQDR